MEHNRNLSHAQPDVIMAFGKQEALRHLSPLAEENVPPRPPRPVMRSFTTSTSRNTSPTRKTSFAASVDRYRLDALAVLRIWWLQFSSWANRFWWRDVRGRCPDYGCHRKLIRAWMKPYGFPGRTCPQDHHFYLEGAPRWH